MWFENIWDLKKWDLSLIVMYMRFKGKMSYIWDLNNLISDCIHIKIELRIYVLLALKSHIRHFLNYIYIDLHFSDDCKKQPYSGWGNGRGSSILRPRYNRACDQYFRVETYTQRLWPVFFVCIACGYWTWAHHKPYFCTSLGRRSQPECG